MARTRTERFVRPVEVLHFDREDKNNPDNRRAQLRLIKVAQTFTKPSNASTKWTPEGEPRESRIVAWTDYSPEEEEDPTPEALAAKADRIGHFSRQYSNDPLRFVSPDKRRELKELAETDPAAYNKAMNEVCQWTRLPDPTGEFHMCDEMGRPFFYQDRVQFIDPNEPHQETPRKSGFFDDLERMQAEGRKYNAIGPKKTWERRDEYREIAQPAEKAAPAETNATATVDASSSF